MDLRRGHPKKKSQNFGLFPYGRGGAQPHSISFGGVFPNNTEAFMVDEISTKVRIYLPKVFLSTNIYEFLMKRIGSPKNSNFFYRWLPLWLLVSTIHVATLPNL